MNLELSLKLNPHYLSYSCRFRFLLLPKNKFVNFIITLHPITGIIVCIRIVF